MSKQKIPALEYLRGLAMLGVIGIHTGSSALSVPNVTINIHLFALLDIVSRFSVPIFFFISAFGLFVNHNLRDKLDYTAFMLRRSRTVLLPYLVWSILYLIRYTWTSGDFSPWHFSLNVQYLLFGRACYHLYFLVILLWFYTLMPLWRMVLRRMIQHPLSSLTLLFGLQMAFNYYVNGYVRPTFTNTWVNLALQYRVSYWFPYYLFIFLFGGVCALYYQQFLALLQKYKQAVTGFFLLSLTGLLSFYYYLLLCKGYSLESTANTAHQLSAPGLLYTLGATLFLFLLCANADPASRLAKLLASLGRHSYFVYLVHPFVMYSLVGWITNRDLTFSTPVILVLYGLVTGLSLLISLISQKIGRQWPTVALLLNGTSMKKR